MTAKAQKYNDLTMTEDRRPAYNNAYGRPAGSVETDVFELYLSYVSGDTLLL